MTMSFRTHRTYEPHERSVSEARRFVRSTLDQWGVGEVTDLAVLAVSELVTNAVVHAGTTVRVGLAIVDGSLRLEVQDSHTERAVPLLQPQPSAEAEGGRGLLITSALAPNWGVEYTPTAKTVWLAFTLGSHPDPAENGNGEAPDAVEPPRPVTAGGTTAGNPPPASAPPPAGLRDSALNRLALDDYLSLAVERARETVAADATYLMLAREFDLDFEVRAVSGLDDAVRGTRWDSSSPGTPDPRNPHLPVVVPDLSVTEVPMLADSGFKSLVAVPVTVDGRLTGALGAVSYRLNGFTDEQAGLLQRVADHMAVAADRARLQASERERRGWLSFLAVAGDLLAGTLDQRMTMAITGQIMVPQLANWCAVYLNDERGAPVLHHVWHHDERLNDPLHEALEELTPDQLRETEDPLLRGELLGLPLIARGQEIGTLVLGRDTGHALTGELRLVTDSIVRRVALAIDNAQAHGDLQAVGKALQNSLLPPSLPALPDLDVGVVYQAAGETSTVGGDFYDLFALGGGRWCFVVGDVCGTGAEAAAVTGLARHTIRALALAGFPVADIMERLNAAILEEGERSRFLTLVCGFMEPVSRGRVLMSLVCAGHPSPFLVRPDGAVRQIGRPQSLLGVFDDVRFTSEEIVLERGELLVTVTDGVLERRDGDRMLSEEGLVAELREVSRLSAQAVAERVRRLVVDFAPTPQLDDMAILAIRLGKA